MALASVILPRKGERQMFPDLSPPFVHREDFTIRFSRNIQELTCFWIGISQVSAQVAMLWPIVTGTLILRQICTQHYKYT